MARQNNRRPNNRRNNNHKAKGKKRLALLDPAKQESTGSEAVFLRFLVDSRAMVTVCLVTGEQLRGRVRYYDGDCFSLGPADGGPKIFLRKNSVRYIIEETSGAELSLDSQPAD
jgi:hypothetical protein